MTTPDVNQQATAVLATPAMPRVNLLPTEIAAAARFRRLQFAMGAAVVGAAVVVGGLYVHDKSAVNGAQSDLDAATARQTTTQQELTSLHSVADVYAQVAAKEAMLQQAMGQEVDWSKYMSDLSLRIPDNVWLTNIQATQTTTGLSAPTTVAAPAGGTTGIGTINFSGVAFSHDDVATWLDVLAKETGFADPYFSNSTRALIGNKKVVNFASSVVVTDDAKSGRFTKPAGS